MIHITHICTLYSIVVSVAGACKGYGLVRFGSQCAGLQARHVLEGQLIRGHTIDCGWLAEGTYLPADLHSKVGTGGGSAHQGAHHRLRLAG